MKRLMLDHFRRWWWVLVLVGVLEFLLGVYVVSYPEQPCEFWALMLTMWSGALNLSTDMRRGRGHFRAITTLPLTGRQMGRAWWLASVPFPAAALAVLLFVGAGVSWRLHPGDAFPRMT